MTKVTKLTEGQREARRSRFASIERALHAVMDKGTVRYKTLEALAYCQGLADAGHTALAGDDQALDAEALADCAPDALADGDVPGDPGTSADATGTSTGGDPAPLGDPSATTYGACDQVRAMLGLGADELSDDEITDAARLTGANRTLAVHPFLVAEALERRRP
jgi:hypothetical protein